MMLLERAILYQATSGRDGAADVRECPRPEEVRAMAARVRGWSAREREGCCVCRDVAVALRDGQPFCATHREEYRRSAPIVPVTPASAESRADLFESGTVSGYPIVFDTPSLDLGGFIEVVRPSAVDRTLRESADALALWGHDPKETIGRISAGTLQVRKTTVGLATAIDMPKWASAYTESVERADVSGGSFGFRARSDEWSLQNGMPFRELLDLDISEISIVSWPAYPSTWMRIGGMSTGRDFAPSRAWRERHLRAQGIR